MDLKRFSLKPMTVGGILDRTFSIYRKNFIAILGFSALISGLYNLLTLVLNQALSPPGMMSDPWELIIQGIRIGDFEGFIAGFAEPGPGVEEALQMMLVSFLTMIIAGLGYIFVEPFVQGGIIHITSQALHGVSVDLSDAFRATGKRYGRLIATSLSLIAYYIGVSVIGGIIVLMFLVPGLVMGIIAGENPSGGMIALFVVLLILFLLVLLAFAVISHSLIALVYPVVVAEGSFHFNAIGRSIKLVGKKFWKVFGVTALVYLLSYAIIAAMGIFSFGIALFSPIGSVFQEVLTLLISALVLPIIHIAVTLLYYDLRIRLEGYDLELLTRGMEGMDA
ncbi:MAG: hypothetical protein ACOX6S_06905 [Clostridia bacterium]|jgi:hypothetical protein